MLEKLAHFFDGVLAIVGGITRSVLKRAASDSRSDHNRIDSHKVATLSQTVKPTLIEHANCGPYF